MDPKEGVAAPQIKTEQGTTATTIKTEPGLPGAVKEEPSTTSLQDDKRMTRLLQEYGGRAPQPPRRVVRYPSSRKLRCPRPSCSFMAARQDTIENHVAFKHDGATKPFKCKFRRCQAQYWHKASLTAHQNKMHPKKPRERNNNLTPSAPKNTLRLKREIKQEQEHDHKNVKMRQIEKVRMEVSEIEKRIAANKGEEEEAAECLRLEERLTFHKRSLDNFETDGNDELAKLRMVSIDAISKCRSALKQAATSPLLKLGPSTATTETPNDEQRMNEREMKKESGDSDSVEEPSTSHPTPQIQENNIVTSSTEDTIEILSDDTDDEVEILH